MQRKHLVILPSLLASALLAACGNSPGQAGKPAAGDDHGHAHTEGDGHDHGDHAHDDGHSHGETVALGEQSVGGFQVKASRDGEIKAGGDAPIDVWVTGGAKVATVRFWIGTEDGKGSMKAKADLEGDHWHTHVEVPSPLPEGSKLWIEIEAEGGAKSAVAFDLKAAG